METSNYSVIRETNDLILYLSTNNGASVFIKHPKNENGILLNTREFHNQKFLQTITHNHDVGFEFLNPTFDGTLLVYPDISKVVDWIATDSTPQASFIPLEEYSEEMIQFMKFCIKIPFEKIPLEIKADSHQRIHNLLNNFEKDSLILQEAEMITERDRIKMKKILEKGSQKQAFQHHDLVPWHMARKRSDRKLILADSGWSGWSLKYYDIAYFVLQMIGYTERTDEALRFLEIAKNEFQFDAQFQKTLSTPLSYRGIRLALELYNQGKVKNAQNVLLIVLSGI